MSSVLDSLSAACSDNIAVIAGAGAVVLGVVVASRAVDWVRCVVIEREASREYYDRYGR